MRRFGDPRDILQTYTDRPGAYGVILTPRGILTTFQGGAYNEWQLPGGGIDAGETPIRALHREVMEETGTRIQPIRKLGAYQRFVFMPEYEIWARKVCHIFLCKAGRMVCPPLEPDHQRAEMDVPTALARLKSQADRQFVARYFGINS